MRFMVFDPNGNLLSAVNLDTRGPKAIPNACSACHGVPGGYAAPQGGYQKQNLGRYIPYDEGNLVFSSASNLTQSAQESQIKGMNLIVLNTTLDQLGQQGRPVTTDPIYQLIHAMYDVNPCDPSNVQPLAANTQAALATPCGMLQAPVSLDEKSAYWAIYSPYCRSCHVANGVDQFPPPTGPGQIKSLFGSSDICNPITANPAAKMPNSKVAFDRFWATHIGPTAATFSDSDLPYFLSTEFAQSQSLGCTLDSFPPPVQ
jgi:mono/diheme cytochrome c family protein